MPPFDARQLPFLNRDMLKFEQGTGFSLILDGIFNTDSNYILSGMTKDGPFRHKFAPVGNLTLESFQFGISDVPIVFTLLGEIGETGTNRCQVAVHLGINGDRAFLLTQGQPGELFSIGWPYNGVIAPLQTRGEFITKSGSDPAAGLTSSLTLPTRSWMRVSGVQATLVTDATVANRRVRLEIVPPDGVDVITATTPSVQTASQTFLYSFFSGASLTDDTVGLIKQAPMPPDLILPPSTVIRVIATNMQAGDNWGALSVIGEQLLAPR